MSADQDLDLIRRAAAGYLRAGGTESVDLELCEVEDVELADGGETTRYVRLYSVVGDVLAVYRVRKNDGHLIRLRRPPRAARTSASARLPRRTSEEAQLLDATPEMLHELEAAHHIIGFAIKMLDDEQKAELKRLVDMRGLTGEEGNSTRYWERREIIAKAGLLVRKAVPKADKRDDDLDESVPF